MSSSNQRESRPYCFRVVDSTGRTLALAETRRSAEEALRKEEQRQAALVAYAPDFWRPRLHALEILEYVR